MIDDITIKELSHEALLRLADSYADLSLKLRVAADAKAAALSREQQRQRTRHELRAIPDIVAGYEAVGMTRDAATRAAGIAVGVDARCVEAHMVRADRDAKRRAKRDRDAEIIALAADGMTARQIAERIGVHFTTAARVLRGSFRVQEKPDTSNYGLHQNHSRRAASGKLARRSGVQ